MQPTQGNQVRGIVTFTSVAGGVRIEADITGLTTGKYGFHVHQWKQDTGRLLPPRAGSRAGMPGA
jgi:Cu/Zn superoxide dismutase